MKGFATKTAVCLMVLMIIFYVSPGVLADWEPSTEPERPIKGGYKIDIDKYYFDSGSYSHFGECTSGYVASFSGYTGYITAGHCIDGIANPALYYDYDWVIYQPSHLLRYSYYAGSPVAAYGDFSYIDTAFIWYDDVEPRILTVDAYGNPVNAPVVSYYSWNEIHEYRTLEGVTIMKTGFATGVTSGEYEYSFTEIKTADGVTYKYLIFFTYTSSPGDSGGSVYKRILERIDGEWVTEAKLIGHHIGRFKYLGIWYAGAISADGVRLEVGITPLTI